MLQFNKSLFFPHKGVDSSEHDSKPERSVKYTIRKKKKLSIKF